MRKTAVVTGASSGIGKAYAEKLASLGYDLVITGRRKDLLKELKLNLAEKYKINVDVKIVEFSSKDEVIKFCLFLNRRDDIYVLVNNAGFGTEGYFGAENTSDQIKMLDVHVYASVLSVQAVLTKMKERKSGVIINVASVAAFLPLPGNVMYSATKNFLLMFSESLQMEVQKYGIYVQALCPGFTRTDFHSRIGFDTSKISSRLFKWKAPEDVVEKSWKCVSRGKVVCVTGSMYLILLRRCFPNLYNAILNNYLKKHQ